MQIQQTVTAARTDSQRLRTQAKALHQQSQATSRSHDCIAV